MLHTPSSTLEFTLHSPDSSNPLPLSNTFLSRGRAQGESAHFPGTYMLSALVQDGADCLGKAALCRAGWARLSGMSQSLGGFYSQSGLDNTKPHGTDEGAEPPPFWQGFPCCFAPMFCMAFDRCS